MADHEAHCHDEGETAEGDGREANGKGNDVYREDGNRVDQPEEFWTAVEKGIEPSQRGGFHQAGDEWPANVPGDCEGEQGTNNIADPGVEHTRPYAEECTDGNGDEATGDRCDDDFQGNEANDRERANRAELLHPAFHRGLGGERGFPHEEECSECEGNRCYTQVFRLDVHPPVHGGIVAAPKVTRYTLPMRRILTSAAFLLLVPFAVHAQTASSGTEQINRFDAHITLQADGSMQVVETIQYDLGPYAKHGIYRTLPYQYTRDGASYNLRYHVASVADSQGNAIPKKVQTTGGYVKIRIGDPKATITGVHTYVITYTVQRAIRFFDTHDGLYWNVTGNEWTVPIQEASVLVVPPNGVAVNNVACYTGAVNSTATDCFVSDGGTQPSIEATRHFTLGEGLTIAVALPVGSIAKPTQSQLASWFIADNWYIAVSIFLWAFFHWRWYKRGRDPRGRGTVVPQYEAPDTMAPYAIGALDTMVGGKEISATLIHLATRGYLTIADPGKGDYTFTLRKPVDASLAKPEQLLLDGMFGTGAKAGSVVTLASLKNVFYTHLPGIKSAMSEEIVERGYYAKNPMVVRALSFALYVVIIGVLALIIFAIQAVVTVTSVGSIAIAGILASIYAWLMSAMTKRGAEVLEEVQGFKWFLSVTEKERLKFHNALAKKPEQFEKFLPYAMVLGVEKEWAGQFKDMLREPPGWYQGQPGSMFNTLLFVSMMSNLSTSVNQSFAAQPRSAGGSGFGGGGFSGGGFGGGGGGSW